MKKKKQKQMKLLKCFCNKPPRKGKKKPGLIYYYNYFCLKCDIHTFYTKDLECAAELWNSTIKNKVRSGFEIITKKRLNED